MTNEKMPVAEAMDATEVEANSYELAFHVLPTVAEGEVPAVFEEIKSNLKAVGAEIFDEEEPKRFDLAYEVVKHLEGKNRKFNSAYFGWVRFKVTAEDVLKFMADMEYNKNILRHLLIKLTKVEEENPFRFHEALGDRKMVTEVEEAEVVPAKEAPAKDEEEENETEVKEDTAEVTTEAEEDKA